MTLTTEERDLLICGLNSITGGCQSAEPLLAKLRAPGNTAGMTREELRTLARRHDVPRGRTKTHTLNNLNLHKVACIYCGTILKETP